MVATTVVRRRSPRLTALNASPEDEKPKAVASSTRKSAKVPTRASKPKPTNDSKRPKRVAAPKKDDQSKKSKAAKAPPATLPRTRETEIKEKGSTWVMGIDEAGRGPLAGPVVAAAAVVPTDIPGITDSKKITCEKAREELYSEIVASADVSWSVAVVDAKRIDEINILQATMQAMKMAASALVQTDSEEGWMEACKRPACASRKGCYVACGGKLLKPQSTGKEEDDAGKEASVPPYYYALVDGNRLPQDLPCEGESIVKGDSKEFSIAAASILAKVTRDRLMHSYDKLYPDYKLGKHKGYPTREHMSAVCECGASPIHRRTFAPLKHMEFDENGKVVDSNE